MSTSTARATAHREERADLLTSHAFALLMGLTAETLIEAADIAAEEREALRDGRPLVERPKRRARFAVPLPLPVVHPMGSYRWRPSAVVTYLLAAGFAVPEALLVRAKKDGWKPAEEEGT